ncbi:MAG: alpha/beta hydrolase [Pseudorhodoplanes sp.]
MSAAIFRHFDQAALNREYDNRAKVANTGLNLYRAYWKQNSEVARATLNCSLDLPYGKSSDETLNVFRVGRRGGVTPVQIYIHGGYWHFGDKSECSYVALGFSGLGMTTVVINYGLAPAVPLVRQIEQCERAIRWVSENIADFGGDPESIFLTGHSAGAHLAAMAVAERPRDSGVQPAASLVRGVCAISGIYDLEPIALTTVNEPLRLTAQDVAELSPARLKGPVKTPVMVGVGALEGEEFTRQTDLLASQWSQNSSDVTRKIYAGDDHFSIRTGLADPKSEICRDIEALVSRSAVGVRRTADTAQSITSVAS